MSLSFFELLVAAERLFNSVLVRKFCVFLCLHFARVFYSLKTVYLYLSHTHNFTAVTMNLPRIHSFVYRPRGQEVLKVRMLDLL